MDFSKAYLAIVNASVEQDTKEIPLILSAIDFKNKTCLEIGTGPFARLAIKIAKSQNPPKSITGIEQYQEAAEKANQEIKKQGLENTISVIQIPPH